MFTRLSGFPPPILNLKAVPHAPDRLDVLRLGGVELDLLADLFDVDGDGGDVADRVHVPDFAEELVLGEDMIRVFGEEGEEVELFVRECFLRAVDPDAARGLVDLDAADFDDVIFRPAAADEALVPGEVRLDPGDQLARGERLDHVVVGAEAEAVNFVDVVFFGRDNDDRDVLFLADAAAEFKTIQARQHQVEHDQVKVLRARRIETGLTVARDLDFKIRELEVVFFEVCDRLFIFYDQYSAHGVSFL